MGSISTLFPKLNISDKAINLVIHAESALKMNFESIDDISLRNQAKVLSAFRKYRVEGRHFAGSTGYGYGDIGRDLLDLVFADVFHTQAAIVRPQIVSGTHALSLCLYALCKRGTRILSITGNPYDTLLETIGLAGKSESSIDSLLDLGVQYESISLTSEGRIDTGSVIMALKNKTSDTLVYLQRSRGYDWRPSVSISDIRKVIETIRAVSPDAIIVVDNCYGEFVETEEPTDAGADLIIGSLIKNPGGGLAPTGAYIAGKKKLIERIQYRLTAPGIGMEVGSWPAGYQPFYQGLFLAPHIVGQCMKGAVLLSAVFEEMGYEVMPNAPSMRSDITQSIKFNSEQKLLKFCRIVQSASPVDGHVVPEPWPMPGYQNDVVMAAGTFIQGASIELSADAPIKPPYIGYIQGGLTYEHCKIALLMLVSEMLES
jgi:cystathionine beta-lyase family protein involved in aluminum resistance